LVWFGEIERKLAKLSINSFTYRPSSLLFYGSAYSSAGICGLIWNTYIAHIHMNVEIGTEEIEDGF
jgi:hypothetical protein